MFNLVDANDDEDEAFSLDSTTPSEKETTAEALAALALDAALTRKSRGILKQSPRLTIVKVADAAWVDLISAAIRTMDRAPHICLAVERRRSAGVLHRIGEDSVKYLQQGRSVLCISPDPDEILDETVLLAADLTIEIPALTPELLRKVIRRITGGIARGVTAQMAAVELPVILTVVRPDLTAGECVAKLRDAVSRRGKSSGAFVPLLTELPLTDPIRKWTDQLLAELGAVKDGTMPPDGLVFAMLEGPPGTGKTLIAESLARTAGWNFVPTTVGGWFTSGDGALGGVAKNIKAFVDLVIAGAPAIGFLDEVDAIPNRATMDNRGRDWWTPVINLFLTEVDRLRKSGKRVLLLGATNYYHHLDAALVRPGRMQQRISVLPPQTEPEALALLRFYLKDELTGADLGKLARLGQGATPAMVEGWVKEARGIARAGSRSLQAADLLEQMLPRDERSPEDVHAIALHEIGHAVVAHRLGIEVERVTLVPKGDTGGHTKTVLPTIVPTWERLCDLVTVSLGGRAADVVLGAGANTGAETDLSNATSLLLGAFERQGLRDGLAYLPDLGVRRREGMAAVEAQLALLLKRAMTIIEADRGVAAELAERLIVERMLSGKDVADKLGRGPVARVPVDRVPPAPKRHRLAARADRRV